ncbi:hypothetical protein PL11_003450 [Lentilactobacillus curieae]|uniref:Uncharacterized protein n=1 Tax=Lentilactobacillus curieae TaxID=1138822 RepID=A0A1S6QHG0_9LACO|nr:hypothetical protein [Lentilactobacillus curieae]AQW21041.1 hypothetical protein PL11_003450 [Lentilactobacillus curieae]
MKKRYIFLSVAALLGVGAFADNAVAATTSSQVAAKPQAETSEALVFSLQNGSPAAYGKDLTVKVYDGQKLVTTKVIKKTTDEYPSLANTGVTLTTKDGLVKGRTYKLVLTSDNQQVKPLTETFEFGDKQELDVEVDAFAYLAGKRVFKIVDADSGKPIANTSLKEIPNLNGAVKDNQKIAKHTDENGLVTVSTDDKEFIRDVIYHFDIDGYNQVGVMNFNLIGGEKGDKVEVIKVKPVTVAKPQVETSEALVFSLQNGSPAAYGKDLTVKVYDGQKLITTKVIKKTTDEYPSLANTGATLTTKDGLVKGQTYKLVLYSDNQKVKPLTESFKFGDKQKLDVEVDAFAYLAGKRVFKIVDADTGKPVKNANLTEIPNLNGAVKDNQKIAKRTDKNGLVTVSTDDKEFIRDVIYHFDIDGYTQVGEMNFNLIGGEKGDKVEVIKVKPAKVIKPSVPAKPASPVEQPSTQQPVSQTQQPSSQPVAPTESTNSTPAVQNPAPVVNSNSSTSQPAKPVKKNNSADLLATKFVKGKRYVKVSGSHRFYSNYHLNKWVKTRTHKQFTVKAKLVIEKQGHKLNYDLISDRHGHKYVIYAGFVH